MMKMYMNLLTWLGYFVQAALISPQPNGSYCRGNVHCYSKCCFIHKDLAFGICITPPIGMSALCVEQRSVKSNSSESVPLRQQVTNVESTQNPGPILGTLQYPLNQLLSAAYNQGANTGAYVYVCETCETRCCCGTSCCDVSVCTAVPTIAPQLQMPVQVSVGVPCRWCASLCCCGNQCCAPSNCMGGSSQQPGGIAMPQLPAIQNPSNSATATPQSNIYDYYLLTQLIDYYTNLYQNQVNNYRLNRFNQMGPGFPNNFGFPPYPPFNGPYSPNDAPLGNTPLIPNGPGPLNNYGYNGYGPPYGNYYGPGGPMAPSLNNYYGGYGG